jgi:hypothetical protein
MVDALAHRTDQHDDVRVRSSALHGCIVAVLLVGCANATEPSTARDAFVKAYSCISDDITLRPVPRSEWPTGTWNETAEHDERLARFIAVAGCGWWRWTGEGSPIHARRTHSDSAFDPTTVTRASEHESAEFR